MDEKKQLLRTIREEELTLHDLESQKAFQELDHSKNNALLNRKEREDIMKMRKHWSEAILFCIVFIVAADFVMIFLLGFNVISFSGPWTVPAFILDSLIKIIGLAIIVVKFLFNKDSLQK